MSEFRIKSGDIVQRVEFPGEPCVVIPNTHPHDGLFQTVRLVDGFTCGNTYNECGMFSLSGDLALRVGEGGIPGLEPLQEPAPAEIWRAEFSREDWECLRVEYITSKEELDQVCETRRDATSTITKYVRAVE